MLRYKVKDDEAGRVDVFLASKNPELGRSFIKRLIEDGKVDVGGKKTEPSQKLKPGDIVKLDFDLESIKSSEAIELPIIYEDDDCLVIDKPVGILSHAKGRLLLEPTVSSFMLQHSDRISGNRAGIVHRLDRSTSGVMICAKNEHAQAWLQKQFSTRKVEKNYVAIVSGRPKVDEAVIEMPIARNPKIPSRFRVDKAGKPAITKYKLIKSTNNYSELELSPKTGRTHQLRVHLSQIGLPIVGDTFYGGVPADRLYLHALSLNIRLPDGEKHHFEAKLPPEFSKLLDNDK